MTIDALFYRYHLLLVCLDTVCYKLLLRLVDYGFGGQEHVFENLALVDVTESSVDERPWVLVDSKDLLEVIYRQTSKLEAY